MNEIIPTQMIGDVHAPDGRHERARGFEKRLPSAETPPPTEAETPARRDTTSSRCG